MFCCLSCSALVAGFSFMHLFVGFFQCCLCLFHFCLHMYFEVNWVVGLQILHFKNWKKEIASNTTNGYICIRWKKDGTNSLISLIF
jgi:hypothetical protein